MMNLNSISLSETNVVTSTISHELNTPLNAIIGFTDLILEEDSIDDIRGYATIIKNNSSLLLEKIKKIISLNSLDFENEVYLEEVSISVLVEKSQDIIEKEFSKNKRMFSISCNTSEEDQKITIFSDKVKLEKFLSHLLFSAFYLNKEGQVFISFNVVHKDGLKEALQVMVSEEKILNFNELERGFEENIDDVVSTMKFEDGIGINLAICHKISKKIGGHMYLKINSNNKIIAFELPVGNLYGADTHSDNDIKVLIVEDEPIGSATFNRVITEYPFTVIRTSSRGFLAGAAERLARTDIVVINEAMKGEPLKRAMENLLKRDPNVLFLLEDSCFNPDNNLSLHHNNFFHYCKNSTAGKVEQIIDSLILFKNNERSNSYTKRINAL